MALSNLVRCACNVWNSTRSARANSRWLELVAVSGDDESKQRNEIGCRSANRLVKKSAVASGMTRNRPLYMCSNTCTPMYDTAETLDESVIAMCLPFFPPVFAYNATTNRTN